MDEKELQACKKEDKVWMCPIADCGKTLSRKQTLQSHLLSSHTIRAGNPSKRYKLYEESEEVPIPKSTIYYRTMDLYIRQNDREKIRRRLAICNDKLQKDLQHRQKKVDYQQDDVAYSLLPSDLPVSPHTVVAAKTTGNGDCLYNAVSISLKGDESLSRLLREMTAGELCINAKSYANHEHFKNILKHSDATMSMNTYKSISLTEKGAEIFSQTGDFLASVMKVANYTCKPKSWSSLIHIMALSTVINKEIYSIYPDVNKAIRPLLNSKFVPVPKPVVYHDVCLRNDPVFIIWSRDGAFDNRKGTIYEPNHFVPLVHTTATDFDDDAPDSFWLDIADNEEPPDTEVEDKKRPPDNEVEEKKRPTDNEVEDKKGPLDTTIEVKKRLPDTKVENKKESQDTEVGDKNEPKDTEVDEQKGPLDTEVHEKKEPLDNQVDEKKGPLNTKVEDREGPQDTEVYEKRETLDTEVGDKKIPLETEVDEKKEPLNYEIEDRKGPQDTGVGEKKGPQDTEVGDKKGPQDNEVNKKKGQLDTKVNEKKGPQETEVKDKGPQDTEVGDKKEPLDTGIDEKKGPLNTKVEDREGPQDTEVYEKRETLDTEVGDKKIPLETEVDEKKGPLNYEIEDRKGPQDTGVGEKKGPQDTEVGDKKGPQDNEVNKKKGQLDTKVNEKKGPQETEVKDKGPQDTEVGDKKEPLDTGIDEKKGPLNTEVGDKKEPLDTEIDEKKGPLNAEIGDKKRPQDIEVNNTKGSLDTKVGDEKGLQDNEVNERNELLDTKVYERKRTQDIEVEDTEVEDKKGPSDTEVVDKKEPSDTEVEDSTIIHVDAEGTIQDKAKESDGFSTSDERPLSTLVKGKQKGQRAPTIHNCIDDGDTTSDNISLKELQNRKQINNNKKRKRKENSPQIESEDEIDNDDTIIEYESDVDYDILNEGDYDGDEDDIEDEESENEEEGYGNQGLNVIWSNKLKLVKEKEFAGPTPGSKINLTSQSSEIDYFYSILPESLFQLMARSTNAYVSIYEKNKRQKTKYKEWFDKSFEGVKAEDMKAFIGIRIIMGLNPLPCIDDFWSSNPALQNQLISKTMSRKTFKLIQRYFHVNDPINDPTRNADKEAGKEALKKDPLYKVSPLMEKVRKNSMKEYNLHQQVSVDEAMIKCHGQHYGIVGAPNKPAKRGFKIFVLADANTGYLWNFQVYMRKQKEEGLTKRVVENLVEEITMQNHIVFVDKFYTSVPLALSLLEQSTYICGSFNTGRKYWPTDLKVDKRKKKKDDKLRSMKRGDIITRQTTNGKLIATVWQDSKTVYNLSTCYSPITNSRRDKVERKSLNKNGKYEKQEYACPQALVEFNKYMGGVDRHDHLRSNYTLQRISTRWWTYFAWFAFDMALINAFLIFKEKNPKATHKGFQLKVAEQLIGGYCERIRAPRQYTKLALSTQFALTHEKTSMPGRARACRFCSKMKIKNMSGRTRETTFGCAQCNVNLHRECFVPFHESGIMKSSKTDMATQTEMMTPSKLRKRNIVTESPSPRKRVRGDTSIGARRSLEQTQAKTCKEAAAQDKTKMSEVALKRPASTRGKVPPKKKRT